MSDDARTATAPPVSEHLVGEHGTVVVVTVADDVVVRGVDGATARIVAPAGAEALGALVTEAGPNRLEVRAGPGARATAFGLGRMLVFDNGGRGGGRLELEVPRAATVEVTTASGGVRADDLEGPVVVTTASGEVELGCTGGPVRVKTASGRVAIRADRSARPLQANVATISGRVAISALRAHEIVVRTMSGKVDLEAELGADAAHVVETLSGKVRLDLRGGTTVSARTISGQVRCDPELRIRDGGPGTTVVLGDGAARLGVRTASGSITVAGPRGAGAPPAPAAPAAPPAPETPVTAETSDSFDRGTAASAPAAADGPAEQPARDPRLAVLEALERGELDVDEALRRLGAEPREMPDA